MSSLPFAIARRLALVTAATIPSSISLPGCSCGEVGCVDAIFVTVPVDDPAAFENATIEVCVNDVCQSGVITSSNGFFNCAFQGTNHECSTPTDAGELDITILVNASAEDGDHAEVTIVSASGAGLASREGDVTYETSQPNGFGCSPTCHQAHLL